VDLSRSAFTDLPSRELTDTSLKGFPRLLDVALSSIGLVVFLPVISLSAAAVALISGTPVIFSQKRVGRFGNVFTLYKFRTMKQCDSSHLQITASDDKRTTRLGRILRKTKADELPELWNVLKGDMSFVGPRPEVPRHVDLQSAEWKTVLMVRPGITDPVTLRLRNEEELMTQIGEDREQFYRLRLQPFKLSGYCEYLRRRTIWSDLYVLVMSFLVVIMPSLAVPPTADELNIKH
jgi:lipopolysaccharide/colanic/teichoic acid biosynthesis glycosyltransferase